MALGGGSWQSTEHCGCQAAEQAAHSAPGLFPLAHPFGSSVGLQSGQQSGRRLEESPSSLLICFFQEIKGRWVVGIGS